MFYLNNPLYEKIINKPNNNHYIYDSVDVDLNNYYAQQEQREEDFMSNLDDIRENIISYSVDLILGNTSIDEFNYCFNEWLEGFDNWENEYLYDNSFSDCITALRLGYDRFVPLVGDVLDAAIEFACEKENTCIEDILQDGYSLKRLYQDILEDLKDE
jgi:hypothetical protein